MMFVSHLVIATICLALDRRPSSDDPNHGMEDCKTCPLLDKENQQIQHDKPQYSATTLVCFRYYLSLPITVTTGKFHCG